MSGTVIGGRYSLRAGVAGVVFFLLTVPVVAGQDHSAVTLDAIRKAWQNRQDRVRTARLAWDEERTEPKGAISSAFGAEIRRRLPEVEGRIMPSEDKTVSFSGTLDLDRDKVRYSYEGKELVMETQDYRPVQYVSVFDGSNAKDLYEKGTGNANWPVGAIRKGSKYRDASLTSVGPLLMVHRPLTSKLARTFEIRDMTLSARRTVIDGRSCAELERRTPDGQSFTRLWVDMDRDFIPIRQLIVERGEPREQVDIRYRKDTSVGWVPESWTVLSYAMKGRLLIAIKGRIKDALFNVDIESSLFDLSFPPGALVIDERTMEKYLLKHDGSRRPIRAEEIGATYEQAMNSEPGEALLQKRRSFLSTWPGGIILGIGLFALGVLLWRHLQRRQSLRSQPH